MDIEKAIEREVAYLLRGWHKTEEVGEGGTEGDRMVQLDTEKPIESQGRTPEQERLYELDVIEANRIARERAINMTFECPENIPKAEHYGALDPEEREG